MPDNRELFKQETGDIEGVYLLNIDNGMVLIENILLKYLAYGDGVNTVWYVRGKRYPLPTRREVAKYTNHDLLRPEPWHPYLVIPMLLDMLEFYQYGHTIYPELFINNPLTESSYRYHNSIDTGDTDIIMNYVPSISNEDLYEIANVFLSVYSNSIKPIYNEYPNSIYTLCTETNIYRLLRHADVRAYRFSELVD